jgi:hypothetical protein
MLPALSNTSTNSALHAVLLFGGMIIPLSYRSLLILPLTGMAASRVGLWSFDLIQVKQLQETLANHPRRNSLYVT